MAQTRNRPDPATARIYLNKALKQQPAVLKHLGLQSLRKGQSTAIMHLYTHRDTLCFMPTGAGKSLIYTLPALVNGWQTLIVGPLISLMKDQHESLLARQLASGVINSSQENVENAHTFQMWEAGELQFLFVSPERLENERFRDMMKRRPPQFVAVDEAHCISQWAHGFRPSYARIGDFVDWIRPKVVLGITATATEDVEADIRRLLHLEGAVRVCYYPARDNLVYHSGRYDEGRGLIDAVRQSSGSTIVYCGTIKHCEETLALLQGRFPSRSVVMYHGSLSDGERSVAQDQFMSGQAEIVVATNAFGMGINMATIRSIIHRDLPGSVEAISQETGRAGRDGLESHCHLLMDDKWEGLQVYFIEKEFPPEQLVRRVYQLLQVHSSKQAEVKLTLEQLGSMLREHPDKISAAIKFLTSEQVLARTTRGEEPMRIKLLQRHPDKRLEAVYDCVSSLGVKRPDGGFEILSHTLQTGTRMAATKLKTLLKVLDDGGYITYQAPFRGATTQVIGKLEKADFGRYAARRERAFKRLDGLLDFYRSPDAEKAKYLAEFFGRAVDPGH